MRNIQAWIFVRGESEGLPGKNTRPLLGRPLVFYTIEAARKCRYIRDVFVSTDSTTIAAAAEQCGAVVPFLRPSSLASAEVPVYQAWRHAIEWNRAQDEFPRMDILVSLPITTPLKGAEDIERAIDLYLGGGCDAVAAVTPSNRHPSYDMMYRDDNGASRLVLPSKDPLTRHRESSVYDLTNVVYVMGADYAMQNDNWLSGRVKTIVVPNERSIDLRNTMDFLAIEGMLARRNGRPSVNGLKRAAGC